MRLRLSKFSIRENIEKSQSRKNISPLSHSGKKDSFGMSDNVKTYSVAAQPSRKLIPGSLSR